MRIAMRGLFVGVLLLGVAGIASAKKCDPVNNSDDAESVANARDAADAACVCGDLTTFPTHGAYVSCAAGEINTTLDGSDALHNRSCRGKAKKCYAKSTCSKEGFVTCYKTNARGKTTCSVKPDCDHCVAPKNGTACCGTNASCCDPCVPQP
jgi:hypothetical protein